MEGLISTFQIHWNLLIAQAVNFAIVFAVLYYFAFRPLGKLLDERKSEIEKGLKDAEESRLLLKNAEERAEELIKSARKKANEIIKEAKQKHDAMLSQVKEEAERERLSIIQEAKKRAEEEKVKAMDSLFKEITEIIPRAISKILMRELSEEEHHNYLKRATELLKKEL